MTEEDEIVAMIVEEEEETKTKKEVDCCVFFARVFLLRKIVALVGLSPAQPLPTVPSRGIPRRSFNPLHDVHPHSQWGWQVWCEVLGW